MAKILSVVGYANSGKTTFLEGLLPELTAKGIKVAVVKHHGHGDGAGENGTAKDTGRLSRAGAAPVGLVEGNYLTLSYSFPAQLTPTEAAKVIFGVDLVITEGFKRAENPKIEIWRHADQAQPACINDPNLIGLVTCHENDLNVPSFTLDDYTGVAAYIIKYFDLA